MDGVKFIPIIKDPRNVYPVEDTKREYSVGVDKQDDGSNSASFVTNRAGKYKRTSRAVQVTTDANGQTKTRITSLTTPKGATEPSRAITYELPAAKTDAITKHDHGTNAELQVGDKQGPDAVPPFDLRSPHTSLAVEAVIDPAHSHTERFASAIVDATVAGLNPNKR